MVEVYWSVLAARRSRVYICMKPIWVARVVTVHMPRSSGRRPLSPNDFHVLLVLAEQSLYGYALLKAIQVESEGSLNPDIGALYRGLARLCASGYVAETETPEGDGTVVTPGRPRRYYAITPAGRHVLAGEVERLGRALELARHRLAPGETK